MNSEAEIIEIKFRTTDDSAVLLDTKAQNATDRILLMLSKGELSLRLHFAGDKKHVSSLRISNLRSHGPNKNNLDLFLGRPGLERFPLAYS